MGALLKHPLVDCDLEEAALWYSLRNPQAAERLIDECRRVMRQVANDPLRFPLHFPDVRRAKLQGFPHNLYFSVDANSIYILALIHGARDIEQVLRSRREPERE